MSSVKTALIQEAKHTDRLVNRQSTTKKIKDAAKKGAQLVVLQELHESLYFCQSEDPMHFDLATSIPGEVSDYYGKLALDLKIVLVASLFEKRAPGLYHNTAVVFDKDGRVAGKYRKMHIPDDPGFYEKFYFTPGDLGFNPIETSLGKLGVLICWDQWFPEAARLMALGGAQILIYPTAIGWDPKDSPNEKKRQLESWITIQRSHAVANGLPVLSVNRCGFEKPGIQFWGNSFAVGPQGDMLGLASSEAEETLLLDLDLSRSEEVRRIWPFFRDRRIESYQGLLHRYLDDPVS